MCALLLIGRNSVSPWTTLSVASYAGSLEERVGALRTLAAALDESGLGD